MDQVNLNTIFIGGCQRTGTTLLYSLLCKAKDTNPPHPNSEDHYFFDLLALYKIAKSYHEVESYFASDSDFFQFHRSIIYSYLENISRNNNNCNSILLKHPKYTFILPLVRQFFPSSRFIVTIRDPRDVIASWRAVGRKTTGNSIYRDGSIFDLCMRYKAYYYPIAKLATMNDGLSHAALDLRTKQIVIANSKEFSTWKHPNSIQSALNSGIMYVRYEDLINHQKDTLRTIGQFTNLDLDDVDDKVDSTSFYTDTWKPTTTSDKVHSSSIGRYTQTLSQDEIHEIETYCSDIFNIFYPETKSEKDSLKYYLDIGDYKKVIEQGEPLLLHHPSDIDIYTIVAAAKLQSDDLTESLELIKKAIEISPETAYLYANLGVIFSQIGDYEKAVESYKKCLVIDPENYQSKSGLAALSNQRELKNRNN